MANKVLARRGLDLPTFGSTEQCFTNTPRTRRCVKWCIDGIKHIESVASAQKGPYALRMRRSVAEKAFSRKSKKDEHL